ncbi:MAG TPA: tetratricopeptide repeat protein [Candidatus Omnitrophota bacterium]|nr:tetratricopeptide repeat protein [Candidatus Omnitrophota bacterium]
MILNEKVWQKLSHYIGILPIGALFGLVAFVANVEIKDLDLWLHLGVGKFIWENHFVPRVDILSCSIAGSPWINHEWLFQVIVYKIFEIGGAGGLLKMQIVMVCVTMGVLLVLGYAKERQLLITFMLFLVFLVFQQRFTVRPDIFSLFFFAIYIFVLALHIDKRWAPAVIFLIQVLWSNVHGFFFLGPLFVLIGLVSEWLKRHVPLPYEWNDAGRLTDQEFKRLQKIFLLVILACLINPYFIKGAWYPLGVLFTLPGENKVFFEVIQELQKPVTPQTLFDTTHFVYYKLLILISFISFIFNRRKIDISALIFWFVFLIFSLTAVRNAIFFAFAAYLVVMTNVLTISTEDLVPIRFTAKKFQHITSIVFKFLFLLFLFQFGYDVAARGYYDFEKFERKSEYGGISQITYPDKAVDFLVANKIKGNFFNDFNSGAYLVGRVFPDIKVFIDGRTEVYGGEFFREYQKIWAEGDGALFEEKVKNFGITGVFMNSSRQHLPKEFLNYLYHHKEWVPVYFDYDGFIFLKKVPQNQAWIERFAIDLKAWRAKGADLRKIGPAHLIPNRQFFRAYTLYSLGLFEGALSEIQEALELMPNYGIAYHLAGQIYLKQKDFEKAFRHLRVAATMVPAHKQIRIDLAYSYLELNALEGAFEQARLILERWPTDIETHYLLSEVYLREKKYDLALETLREAVDLKPTQANDLVALGDLVFEQHEYHWAKEIYTLALNIEDQKDITHKKLGLSYEKLNDATRARYHFEQSLSVNPQDQEAQEHLKNL